jgi:hypothetical protein
MSFTDLVNGKSILLLSCILLNILFALNNGINKKYYFLAILPLYIFIRQLFVFWDVGVNFDSLNFLIFYFYFVSFILAFHAVKNKKIFIFSFVIIYVLLNFFFGFLDYININLPFIHSDSNQHGRFRGLSSEPNTLAIPLALIIAQIFFYSENNKLSNKYKYLVYVLSSLMIILSTSKAAYLFIITFLILIFITRISLLRFITLCSLLFSLWIILNNIYFYENLSFFNSFISLINLDQIFNEGMDSFIRTLSSLDQFQSGSFGTRLATLYGSLTIFFSSPFFGYGEGATYKYLANYIFNNNLENRELIDHFANNPAFITDKTFLVKFLLDYGITGALLLFFTLSKIIKVVIPNKISVPQVVLLLSLFFLTQNQFLLVFSILFLIFTTPTSNSSIDSSNR